MGRVHVVFGASGALGAAIVRKLAADGVPVRAVVRSLSKAKRLLPESAELVTADARSAAGALQVCRDAAVIYHCVNVPYNLWPRMLPEITDNILAAARRERARIMFAGNVYVYGRLPKAPVREDHPHAAETRKGKLRIELERRLMEAHHSGAVPVVIPRMPDFYGPNVTNKLYGGIFEAALDGKRAMWMANLEAAHDLVYIDDAAAACVLLAATETAYGQAWHVPGAGPLTGRQFLEMIYREAGAPLKVSVVNRFMLWLGGLLDPVAAEVSELLYLFEEPQVLDGTKFRNAFPSFRFTPHEEAVRKTAEWFRERGAERP